MKQSPRTSQNRTSEAREDISEGIVRSSFYERDSNRTALGPFRRRKDPGRATQHRSAERSAKLASDGRGDGVRGARSVPRASPADLEEREPSSRVHGTRHPSSATSRRSLPSTMRSIIETAGYACRPERNEGIPLSWLLSTEIRWRNSDRRRGRRHRADHALSRPLPELRGLRVAPPPATPLSTAPRLRRTTFRWERRVTITTSLRRRRLDPTSASS